MFQASQLVNFATTWRTPLPGGNFAAQLSGFGQTFIVMTEITYIMDKVRYVDKRHVQNLKLYGTYIEVRQGLGMPHSVYCGQNEGSFFQCESS